MSDTRLDNLLKSSEKLGCSKAINEVRWLVIDLAKTVDENQREPLFKLFHQLDEIDGGRAKTEGGK